MRISNCGLLLAGIALATLSACSGEDSAKDADPAKEANRVALAGDTAASAAAPDFGDDTGKYAKDGECDDMRFTGAGMTSTPLLDEDIKHDATDCRAAFNQDRLTFKGDNVTSATLASSAQGDASRIVWGDDNGSFANDGECDDKRFDGEGMTSTQLLDADIKHDASDCRTAFQQGRLALRE